MVTTTLTKPLTEIKIQYLPRGDELPYDDDIPLESERHLYQIILLLETLLPWLRKIGKGYVGGNMFLYFSPNKVKTEMVRGADFFVVTNADFRERKSWVVWEEGLSPNIVIELLSDTTKNEDKTNKKKIYEKELCVSEYFWYDPHNPQDWAGHELIDGSYREKKSDIRGRYICKELGLALVKWYGVFLEREATWLRFETLDGLLLPTKQEKEEEAKQREFEAKQREFEAKQREFEAKQREFEAKQREFEAKQEVLKEKEKADVFAAKLRSLGIDPNKL
ncbi:MAG: Uma2 family endonuclease [Leptospiraceae bacterium]|nr:Uma2 family endonuclease [Leptospiraceae bacterium]